MPDTNIFTLEHFQDKDTENLDFSQFHIVSKDAYHKLTNYYSNGLSRYLNKIKVEAITDTESCKNLWNEFSPNNTIFDSWDFRKSFLDAYKYKLHFIVIKNDKENLALLPLWYEDKDFWSKEKFFCFMGGYFNENNVFRVKDKNLIPLLLYVAPNPLWLDAIMIDPNSPVIDDFKLIPDDPKYVLDIRGLRSSEDYLMSLKKKKRYNLKRDQKHIESLNPEPILNDFSHFNYLIDMNMKRFKTIGSDLADPRKVQAFRNVIKNSGKQYTLKMISITINGEVVASDLIGTFKNVYCPLRGASNIEKYPGIGNYMNLLEVEDAIREGYEYMDFLQTDCNWKKSMNFEEIPLFKYRAG